MTGDRRRGHRTAPAPAEGLRRKVHPNVQLHDSTAEGARVTQGPGFLEAGSKVGADRRVGDFTNSGRRLLCRFMTSPEDENGACILFRALLYSDTKRRFLSFGTERPAKSFIIRMRAHPGLRARLAGFGRTFLLPGRRRCA